MADFLQPGDDGKPFQQPDPRAEKAYNVSAWWEGLSEGERFRMRYIDHTERRFRRMLWGISYDPFDDD